MRHHLTNVSSRVPQAIAGAFVTIALALWGPPAYAQTAADQPTPTSTVEVGGGGISNGSFKAGEFNGLHDKGAFFVGNVDLRGRGAYDSDSAMRWRIRGTDLGLQTRNVAAEAGVQGRFRVLFGYDSLLRNQSDTYQTPLLGAGTSTLTLPGTWLVPNIPSSSTSNNRTNTNSARGLIPSIGTAPYIDLQTGSPTLGQLLLPNAAQLAKTTAAADADVPLFHNVNLASKRQAVTAGANYSFTPTVGVDVSFQTEHKDGMRPLGTVSRNTGGDISTIIPNLIDTDSRQVTSNVSYKGDRDFLQAGYYGAFFDNHVTSMSWQNWATGPTATGDGGTTNRISSAPDNVLHQLNLTARHNFSKTTRLVATGSYGRNTQNDPFLTSPTVPVVPVNSLDGLVIWSSFNAKVTSRPAKGLNLSATYKFNDRDNRTAVHIFQYADAEEALPATPSALFPAGPNNPLGAVVAQNANANRPFSKKSNLFEAEAEYALGGGQWVKGRYNFERINRRCPGSWIDCSNAAETNEHIGRAEWRATVASTLNARVSYAYSQRRAPSYNENAFLALAPYANVSPVGATDGATALSFMLANGWNGWGPALGFADTTSNKNMNLFFPSNNALANVTYGNLNRISDLQGFRRYYVSDRNRNKVRSLLDWSATEALSIDGGVDYTGDTYTDTKYGLQETRLWATNLDGTYSLTEELSASVFYTYENQRGLTAGNTYTANSNAANVNGATALAGNRGCDTYTTLQQRNNNNKLDPCLEWTANMIDKVHTAGFTVARKTAKLDLDGNLVFSRANADNNETGGNWANNLLALPGAPAGTVAAYYIPVTPLPTVTTNTTELRVNGRYAVDEHQSLRVIYSYLRMRSADWSYDGMQIGSGTIAGVLPTNDQPFNYGVNVFAVSYLLAF